MLNPIPVIFTNMKFKTPKYEFEITVKFIFFMIIFVTVITLLITGGLTPDTIIDLLKFFIENLPAVFGS